MAAATATVGCFSPAVASFSFPENRRSTQIEPLCTNSKQNPCSKLHSLRTGRVSALTPKRGRRALFDIRSLGIESEPHSEEEPENSNTVASTDIKLPRRSLLVQFTCNSCGERTKKLINRLAYERGLVFVQCGGCRQIHKLVDNLGLIVEYDFRNTP